ncbi:MAG TPA: quinolinate synthase, partial [Gallionella sp.]|nr:quinolinate synthase [Gallionella sp.]
MSEHVVSIAYDHPGHDLASASIKPVREVAPQDKPALIARIKRLLLEQDAVLVAHYYV